MALRDSTIDTWDEYDCSIAPPAEYTSTHHELAIRVFNTKRDKNTFKLRITEVPRGEERVIARSIAIQPMQKLTDYILLSISLEVDVNT